ncbi:hypothetical protein VTK73DRAFT_7669 [Phialemonium thermophilum]|uniref:Uncharacterized protein n=1 Tax=Phialemonium thermophilum TaxID=223376 RepID=A0ABR3Y6H1_9PEZI
MSQHSTSVSLPRGFRYTAIKTPEPSDGSDNISAPSPPRPRLKLKRRNVTSNSCGPTQQFLASVAAADIPVPSIEEPELRPQNLNMGDAVELATVAPVLDDGRSGLLAPHGRAFSPPKTPAPGSAPSLSPPRYPNWTIGSAISSAESTPDYESSRPSTSRSTQTSDSLFSRLSHVSDEDHFDSPEVESRDKLGLQDDDGDSSLEHAAPINRRRRRAPWTKAMSSHLWSTYLLYLQDPKVTPFRMGATCIPPHGVCLRVAREAKRSWKGSRAKKRADPGNDKTSGSATPTAQETAAYIEWPHTCSATRAHLRKLCKLNATLGPRNVRFASRSPTPFTAAAVRQWNRRSTPAVAQSCFATQDITRSLVISTSDTMQPDGPLARLTTSSLESAHESFPQSPRDATQSLEDATPPANQSGLLLGRFDEEPSFAERRRLGSPFSARSYGPSSSGSLASTLGLNSPMPRRQTHTVGPRRALQSPVRLSRSNTLKRRNAQLSSSRKRPGLESDIWMDPALSSDSQHQDTSVADSTFVRSTRSDDLFAPRASSNQSVLASSTSMPDVGVHLDTSLAPPPRLGSPFSGTGSSFSFPRRMHRNQPGSVDLGVLGRPFATMQQIPDNTAAAQQRRTSLFDRLAYIDQRLKEFRSRDVGRRSESPL